MRTLLIWGLLLGFTFSFAGTPGSQSQNRFDLSTPNSISAKKNIAGALILEYAVPTLGFLYLHQWEKGILPNLTMFSGFVLAFKNADLFDPNKLALKNHEFLFYSGVLIYMAGGAWKYIALYNAFENYNNKLQIGLKPIGDGHSQTIGLALSYRF